MATPLDRKIEELARGALAAHGLSLVQARLSGANGRNTLQVFAEKSDGSPASLDQCAAASRTLSAQLDVAEIINIRYTLEVGSPGLERPLTKPEDYQRFTGKQARVVFTRQLPVEERQLGSVIGQILAVEGPKFTIQPIDMKQVLSVAFTDVNYAHLSPSQQELDALMKQANSKDKH